MEIKEKLILHRGYKGKYPENSKTAFENALKEGFSFETDIRVSKDGIPFLIHDETLYRLFDCFGKVSERNSKELSNLSFKEDKNEKLVSLKELCELIKKNKSSSLTFVHIKELKDIDIVIKILEKYNLRNKFRLFSCDDITLNLVDIIKKKYIGYKVGLHFYENCSFSDEEFKKADFIWADEIIKKNITSELVKSLHGLGKLIYTMSPELILESIFNENIEKRWKELLETGVDGICTDRPEEFLRFFLLFKKN